MAPKAGKKPRAKSPSRSPRARDGTNTSSSQRRRSNSNASADGAASAAATLEAEKVCVEKAIGAEHPEAILSADAASIEEPPVDKEGGSRTERPETDVDQPVEKSLLTAFRALDANHDGFISEEDFRSILVQLGFEEALISTTFRASEANANGFVDYASFLSWIHEAPDEIQTGISSLVAVDGRRGQIVWDGRPDHLFLQIMWLDSGAVDMMKAEAVFPDQYKTQKTMVKTSSLDDAWKEFQSKFDSMTKNLIGALTSGGMDLGEHFDDDREFPDPDPRWRAEHEEVRSRLKAAEFLEHDNKLFWHGRLYGGPEVEPKVVWASDEPPRDDHYCPEWLTASEFQDVLDVAAQKITMLAQLMRMSRKTVLYTGAGISAAVVGQAARSGIHKVGFLNSPLKAVPTFTHRALGVLGVQGLIHSWVQQNHDGLPQKAGFPQERINEVHGSWYDPSNPVVKYNGSLRKEEYHWMIEDTATADLVMVFGSSLGGLNADRLPKRAADRSLAGKVLGTVCINLQQTPHDGMMSLRLFGTSDDILRRLLKELDLDCEAAGPKFEESSCVLVPYDAEGRLLVAGETKKMWLNLNTGVEVRLTEGHNIQGAKQEKYLHIGASEPVTFMACRRSPAEPLGFVRCRDNDMCAFILDIAGVDMNLGLWWLRAAERGAIQRLPVINLHPQYEGETPEGPKAVKVDPRAWWEKGESILPPGAEEVEEKQVMRSASGEKLGGSKLTRALSA